jgi:hypothetical protein
LLLAAAAGQHTGSERRLHWGRLLLLIAWLLLMLMHGVAMLLMLQGAS